MRTLLVPFLAACTASPPSADDTAADTSSDSAPSQPADPADTPFELEVFDASAWVDPFLGTRGSGNVIPGALVPHGMVRASPDTVSKGGSIDAYAWEDSRIEGFTHTHLEGPGGSNNGYSHLLFLPQTGPVDVDRDSRTVGFGHDREAAQPGRYEVTLDNDVRVELTATGHAAVHRYTFPAGSGRVLVDLGHSNGVSFDGSLRIDGNVLSGWGEYIVHPIAAAVSGTDGRTAFTRLYLHAVFDTDIVGTGTFQGRDAVATPGATETSGPWSGGWVELDPDGPRTVQVRIGVSLVSEEQAARNLEVEVGTHDFDAVAADADATWDRVLSRLVLETSDAIRTRTTTALYHSMMQPADYTEADGVYTIGTSGHHETRQAEGFHYVTDDWCMWDTFRTSHPLGSLTEPEWRDDIGQSLLQAYVEGGWLPKCTWNATGYSRVMTGNPAVPILADMVTKGLDRMDLELAWEAIDHAGMQEVPEAVDGLCGYTNLGTPPDYRTLGFIPIECDATQGASMTYEHAFDDWSAARFAEAVGRPQEDIDRYDARASNWKAHWDADVGFPRGLYRDGSRRPGFDPADTSDFNDFVEASAWIFVFGAPHDVPGMIAQHGSEEAFRAKLDAFFDGGFFDPTNQPSFHIPWLYALAGDPWSTQRVVRQTLDERYGIGPDGLPGNDDAGSTSAWALLATLGLYPLAPGDGRYVLAAPRVARAELMLHPGFWDGGSLVIETVGDPETQPYATEVRLDGEVLDRWWVTHEELVGGATLTFVMSETPPSP